ncbi:hypothetical protein [Sinorhizobium meliloti]|uniref:hypothetical protein n=1 Tax=Rhizobium meliloti TaxID=382 RepID=UPI0023807213|nr:hypothetical protein [Sinorhizobium meliloti]MDE3819731.1 hypothetical protein [Sinorhizobium meliloti]
MTAEDRPQIAATEKSMGRGRRIPFIVADGILDELHVQAVFAQHCVPDLAVGSIAMEPGTFLAGSSYFQIKLSGAGSHAAQPEDGSDMPVVASEVVRMLSAIPARSIDIANCPTLIGVTKIVCDAEALNVIIPEAIIAGTVRSLKTRSWNSPANHRWRRSCANDRMASHKPMGFPTISHLSRVPLRGRMMSIF